MSNDLSEVLVVGVSTRSLFNLETENDIFSTQGVEDYRKYQLDNENEILKPGTAFHLIQNLLKLNDIASKQIV